MLTMTLRYGMGYAGKMGNKCWIAEITGTSERYGLARTFIEPDRVEREHFNRARTMLDFTYEIAPGLYERSEGGDREYFMVWEKAGHGTAWKRIDESRVQAIAARMDSGETFEGARFATRPAPEEAAGAVTNGRPEKSAAPAHDPRRPL